ncbi:MAG: ATP-binding protein, partial [Chloroflexota bacterium]|nr:ATP-binding protein [Chloroflexota bacterium]
HARVVQLEKGATPVIEGQPAEAFYALLEGELQVLKTVGGLQVVANTTDHRGVWMGSVPLEGFNPSPIGVRVTRAGRFLRLSSEDVGYMFSHGFPIYEHLITGIRGGAQNLEALVRQQEKLAALGKLSAGLAHELNNPAAAAQQAARQLREETRRLQEAALRMSSTGFTSEQLEGVAVCAREATERAESSVELDPLTRSDREDEVGAWMEEHGLAEGWRLAPTFVGAGLDLAWLSDLAGHVPAPSLDDALHWLDATLTVEGLIDQVEHGTTRISELVGAIKSYSYMDRAQDKEEVDVRQGLDNTLTMLHHRIKQGIEVTREYDPELPRIRAYGGELNQVWTNLIDNALDAMYEWGNLWVRARREDGCVLVEIADDGRGIPQELQSRIFEPFFTTKAVGQGTGLGLDTSYRIVVNRHGGDIQVHSEPGSTRFEVRLPLAQQRG